VSVSVAYVQEAACAEHVMVLKVRVPGGGGGGLLAIAAQRGKPARTGLFDAEARRAAWGARLPPGAVRQKPREEALEGARVVAVSETAIHIVQGEAHRAIRAEGGRIVVTDAPAPDLLPFVDVLSEEGPGREALSARGHALLAALALEAVHHHRADSLRVLDRAQLKIERRHEAIRGDLAKIADADRIAAQAQWLVAEAARAPRGATELVVTDWSTGEAVALTIPLDPSKSAKDQVAAMFKRAKRLRLGAKIAEERLAQADRQLAAVMQARERIQQADAMGAIDDALADAKKSAPRDVATVTRSGPKSRTDRKRVPYRTFFAASGKKLLVGKGAADNDALTLHVAKPHDLWLHAKDRTGAHVIAVLDRGHTAPAEDLVDAAHLAAHFSDAREEAVVDVQYTDRRFVRKPKGSPPGFVIVDREKVLVLRVEPERIRALLEREDLTT
jgi:hypothetical protein